MNRLTQFQYKCTDLISLIVFLVYEVEKINIKKSAENVLLYEHTAELQSWDAMKHDLAKLGTGSLWITWTSHLPLSRNFPHLVPLSPSGISLLDLFIYFYLDSSAANCNLNWSIIEDSFLLRYFIFKFHHQSHRIFNNDDFHCCD